MIEICKKVKLKDLTNEQNEVKIYYIILNKSGVFA